MLITKNYSNRLTDAKMLANYRVPAELSAIETTEDGRAVVIATVDGCLSVLAIADPNKDSFLSTLPSRDETVSFQKIFYNVY